MAIAVIAFLGNPGKKYQDSRHNIGFMVGEAMAAKHGLSWKAEKKFEAECTRFDGLGQDLLLAMPQTYMNDSGKALGAIGRFYKLTPEQFVVVYDDITLDTGKLKLSQQGGNGGHNGIASIQQHLGTGFIRYRIGIGGKAHPEMDLKDHVLGKMSAEEKQLHQQRLPDYLDGLEKTVREGYVAAMNDINRKQPPNP